MFRLRALAVSAGFAFYPPIFSAMALFLLLLLCTGPAIGQVNVVTHHNDNARSGANLAETTLTTSNVNSTKFGKLFARQVDGQVYAQPLYVSSVAIPNQGTHNVVYVATEHNSVYAFDADDPKASRPLWRVQLGPSVPYKVVSLDINLRPEMGITGTPVIDVKSNTIYVVAYTYENNSCVYRLHALDITTGAEQTNSPVVIQGIVAGNGDGSVNGAITFNPVQHLQRPGLLLSKGNVYIAFGSHADRDPYHGWVMAYDASSLAQTAIYCTTPTGSEGAIWQSGQGLAADDSGNIYFGSGNGTSDASNQGDSWVKISSACSLLDWFTPYNTAVLNLNDFDLGTSGMMLVPGTSLAVGGSKDGTLYVLDQNNFTHFNATGDQIFQEFQPCLGHIHGGPVYWNSADSGSLLYVWSENDYLKSFSLSNGRFKTTPFATGPTLLPAGMPGGMLSISANGNTSGSGILWASHPYALDAVHATVEGEIQAFDAANVGTELWNSRQNANRDDVGDFAKYCSVTVANGKMYAATFSGELLVYGPLSQAGTSSGYAINAGGSASGHFLADTDYNGGVLGSVTQYIDTRGLAAWAPQTTYQTARYGSFTYTLPNLTPGASYIVRLHFAELFSTAAGQRQFDVAINGTQVLQNLDIFALTGGLYKAMSREFTATADSGGNITVAFSYNAAGDPQCNGIEVIPVPASSAVCQQVDAATQGNWYGVYGKNGYAVLGDTVSYPAYAQVSTEAGNNYTWVASTVDARALQKASALNDRVAATFYAGTNETIDVNLTDGQTHLVSLYFLDWDGNNSRVQNIDVQDADTGTVINSCTLDNFSNGKYIVWSVQGHVRFRLTEITGQHVVVSGMFFDSTGPSVKFVKSDTITLGSWKGMYGNDGFNIINDTVSYPSYAKVSASGANAYTWNGSTSDVHALQKGSQTATDRIAACWYSASTSGSKYTVDVNLTDGKTHQVALYALDWDQRSRAEKIEVLDADSGAVLDTQSVSSFSNGTYLVWNVAGHVKFRVTLTGGDNAVLSGLFFDPVSVPASATFVKSDTTTQGGWKGVYGSKGYNIINDTVSYPSYAKVSASGANAYTWNGSTSDVHALQKGSQTATDRIAACWYSASTSGSKYTVDVNLTDGKTHQVALYALDWDQRSRAEKIEVLDADSGAVLDTQSVSSFSNGTYLVWNVAGHVKFRVTLTGGDNAVLSGLFFD